jgi:dihydrofolate synthase/folylpolyglutamate synthase
MIDVVAYQSLLQEIFTRFPSVQNVPFSQAYKPGLGGMLAFDEAMGNPSRKFKSVHVAGTNGKGSVANMLASAFDACGYKVGLYTSPHILDFRERMRIGGKMVPKEYVFEFLLKWKPYFEEHGLSFFEITTGMAFKWFADEGVDVAVVEVGLGGRLDSTNIIMPELSVITTIGLDHCAMLGNTLAEIAAEKAGIFKPGVPALVGETTPETLPVFETKAQGPLYVVDDNKNFSPTRTKTFLAKKTTSKSFVRLRELKNFCQFDDTLSKMDLQAEPQMKNIRTVLTAIELLKPEFPALAEEQKVADGIEHTAERMGFHGRWERLSEDPLVIADIGHNAQALESNFRKLEAMGHPIIIYGIMADKDLDAIIPLMPRTATWIFTTPSTKRALPADEIFRRCNMPDAIVINSVKDAVQYAMSLGRPVYIGGSTFVVAEALPCFGKKFEQE